MAVSNGSSQNASKPKLSVSQIKFLGEIASGYSVRNSAKRAGISYGTVYKWKRTEPDFCKAYQEVFTSLWEQTKEGIKSLAGLSIKVLSDVMKNKYAQDKDKIAAVKIVLDNSHKVVMDDELRKRVETLITKMEAEG